ncbi:Alpha/Beta hydrolase protein [Russula earlei]|uniref:Alpha/Beta hydrolase protein n=1 Tax=Russula earlei TaxID=71964 RepID=A0ACC0UEU5_9AGAM|nr:Alpha/Beta hydrolase protein [Russula earlei]
MTAVVPKHLIFLHKARRLCIILGCIYVLVVALGTTPFAQAQLLFMHNLRRPFFVQYDMPEMYDLAPFKVQNVRIQTADNETLGAWFTFADPFYASHKHHLLSVPTTSLSSPGSNAVSRDDLIPYATRLRANVLAPDYRGFADSTGTPTEAGLTLDTRAAWDWLRAHGASPDNLLIVGSSLGTGVAVQFASALEEEVARADTEARVVNSKLEALIDTYYILGLMPLFAPLRTVPYLFEAFPNWPLALSAGTSYVPSYSGILLDVKAPVLIVHAEDDQDIPVWHAQQLFNAFLEKYLPPLPEITAKMVEGSTETVKERFSALLEERATRRGELVAVQEMERVGRIEEFSRDRGDGKVVFLHTWWGAHDVGLVEGVQDYMAEMFKIG